VNAARKVVKAPLSRSQANINATRQAACRTGKYARPYVAPVRVIIAPTVQRATSRNNAPLSDIALAIAIQHAEALGPSGAKQLAKLRTEHASRQPLAPLPPPRRPRCARIAAPVRKVAATAAARKRRSAAKHVPSRRTKPAPKPSTKPAPAPTHKTTKRARSQA
jgi:hypothetical protein